MSPGAQARYVLFLVLVLIVQALFLFRNGALMINLHEGDALHMVQIVMRMELGQLPHLDFLTPIGVLAFAPIVAFLGLGVGKAFLAANVLMGALAVPVLWWLAVTRLRRGLAYAFGAGVVILLTAMVHGGVLQVSSVSMYYNRWAWGIGFMAVALAVLPARVRRHQLLDGVLLGGLVSALALLKATYFVALLPPIVLAVLLRRQWRTLLAGLVTGAVVILGIGLALGVDFWLAYVGDLRLVREAGLRSYPSQPLGYLLIGPPFLLPNLVAVVAVIALRQAGRSVEGVVLLTLLPGFVLITWQNWGNDPQWLFLLGILLLALRPRRAARNALGWDLRGTLAVLAALALAMIAPSALNVAASALRYAKLDPADYTAILPEPRHGNLVFKTGLLYAPEERRLRPLPDPELAARGEEFTRPRRAFLYGEELPWCKLHRGLVGYLQAFARDLQRAVPQTAGRSVFVADFLSNLWLFGPTAPIPGGSPWYYGGDAGLGRADYLLVPMCPVSPRLRAQVLERLDQPDAPKFEEVRRTADYILFRRRPDG